MRQEPTPPTAETARLDSAPEAGVRLAVDSEVGDFVLLRRLGEGGMGEVWAARQRSLQREVALKLLLPRYGLEHLGAAIRLQREAMAGGKLRHPGIVAVHGTGQSEGIHYIVQELVGDGRNLADAIGELRRREELPDDHDRRMAALFADLADALESAHAAGVIHRDIKPGNILLDAGDRPRLADFGIALVEDGLELTRSGEFAGTPFYMSPEQALGKRTAIDHRTDIFSLGATLYEALTLVRPFPGGTSHEVLQKIALEDPPDPRRFRARVPRDLAVLCLQCLEKRPDQRYPSMAALAADLRRVVANEPIEARPPSLPRRAHKWVVRNPARAVAAGAGLALLGVLAIGSLLLSRKNAELEQRASEAETARGEAVANEEQARLQEELARSALEEARWQSYSANLHAAKAAIEDGDVGEARRRLELCPEELRAWEWEHLLLATDVSSRVLRGHAGRVGDVAWSPLDERIASVSGSGELFVWSADQEESLLRTQLGRGRAHSLSWSPDGAWIATGSSTGELALWAAADLAPLDAFARARGSVQCVRWSPDGALVAVGCSDGSVELWSPEGGAGLLPLPGHDGNVRSLSWSPDSERLASSSADGTVRVWEVRSRAELLLLRENANKVECVSWSPDGTRLASAGRDGVVLVWSAEDGSQLARWLGHERQVLALNWSPDGSLFASSAADRSLLLRDARSGAILARWLGHEEAAQALAWSPDGARLASSSFDGELRVWEASVGATVVQLGGRHYDLDHLAWHPDGSLLAAAVRDGLVRLWDAQSGRQLRELQGAASPARALAWRASDGALVVAHGDGSLRWWAGADGPLERTLAAHAGPANDASWSRDEAWLASCGSDGSLRLGAGRDGVEQQRLQLDAEALNALAWHPDQARLVVGSSTGALWAWDALEGARAFGEAIEAAWNELRWSPAGDRLVGAARNGSVYLWEARSGELLARLEDHTGQVYAADWSPDGRRLASVSVDGSIRLWRGSDGAVLGRLDIQGRQLRSLAWSPDGRLLATSMGSSVLVHHAHKERALPWWREADLRRRARALVEHELEQQRTPWEAWARIEARRDLAPALLLEVRIAAADELRLYAREFLEVCRALAEAGASSALPALDLEQALQLGALSADRHDVPSLRLAEAWAQLAAGSPERARACVERALTLEASSDESAAELLAELAALERALEERTP